MAQQSEGEQPELYGLLEDHEAGRLEPHEVRLPVEVLPARATALRRVAADIELLIGLRLAVGDERPLPYAAALCAQRNGLRDKMHASRALRELERRGVLRCVGRMPRRASGPPDGTKLYAPPLPAGALARDVASSDRVEALDGAQLAQEPVGCDPAIEVDQQFAVQRAVTVPVAPRGAVRVVTSGHGAGVTIEHADDDNCPIGRQGTLRVERAGAAERPDPAWLAEIHRRFGGRG